MCTWSSGRRLALQEGLRCDFVLKQKTEITATFKIRTNYAFVTSQKVVPGKLGGLAAADAPLQFSCQEGFPRWNLSCVAFHAEGFRYLET